MMKTALACFPRLMSASLCLMLATLVLSVLPATAQQGHSTMSNMNGAQNDTPANATAADKKFVKDAAQGGLAEVELGRMATEKASSDEVKKFGQRMVDDHTKANDQLKQVAQSQGLEIPTDLSAKDKMLKERLSKLSGPAFDRVYMQNMVKDHKQDVADFSRESRSGADSAVKDFASQTLPTLKSHLQEAEKIAPMTQSGAAGAGSE